MVAGSSAFTRVAARALVAGAVTSAACLAYGAGYEVRAFRLRRATVPVLPAGQRPLRVLHLSDLHLTLGQDKKRAWVRSLARLEPDLVVNTGDTLAHPRAVPDVLDALGPLLELPGVFVLGSNDYYAPSVKNPFLYLVGGTGDDARRTPTHRAVPDLPWQDLVDGMSRQGWVDLSNTTGRLQVDGRELAFRGVDDPHVRRDRYERVAGPPEDDADLAVGVVHAPYLRVVDSMAADRLPLVLAGHTHGGQLCVPGWGALVSNCDLPPRRAKGLSRHAEDTWLHVSAGIGTSPYAPVRFACYPEATLLTLTSR
ncbi:MAG TPA: metallophosphoesterase [Actinomycetes bacterium]|nr:metallophosphoesterase [Actinomycetes bacterium]